MTRATLHANVGDHADMVAAIVATYRDATDAQRAAGRAWYPAAGRMVRSIATDTRLPADRIALALAALSPRNPWRWNVADAYLYATAARAVLDGATDDGPPPATTFGSNRRAAWAALGVHAGDTLGVDPWQSAAPKVRAFVAAILGDAGSVVVDVWAIRVATRGALERVTPVEYGPVADAYRDAAIEVGETPAAVQAITWLVAQSAGLGSNRRGDHAATFKRGTPDAVRRLFAEDGGL